MSTPLPNWAAKHEPASARLLGSDHTHLGDVEIVEIPPSVAIGISCGRFPKGYPHVDPNEDAVFATSDGTTTVLAVADGHRGVEAAHAAIAAIADNAIGFDTAPLDDIVRMLSEQAVDAVRSATPHLQPPRDASGTALTIAAIRSGSVSAMTLGDTACFVVTRRHVSRLGSPTEFLSATSRSDLVAVQEAPLPSKAAIIVTSDGFSSFARPIDRILRSERSHQASDAVANLVAAAFAGGAGDNVTAAVFNPSP